MSTYVLVFGLAAAGGLVMTPLARWLGRRLGVLDRADGFRKVHQKPVPRTGGAAIFVAFFASLCAACLLSRSEQLFCCLGSDDFLWLLCGAAAVLAIGLWDDVRGLGAGWKLLLLTLVAAGMYAAGYRIGAVTNPFGGSIHLGFWAVPITLFWFLGCMNAINFIDGLDGLAAGASMFVAATILVSGFLFGNIGGSILAMALLGVTGGFLVFNFRPASIYLGDSGSYLLGYMIACVGLLSTRKAHTVVALLVPVIAMGMPIFDTALAILRRWARAVPIFAGDRHHLHHKLLKMGLSHRQAVLLMYVACFGLAGMALMMTATHGQQSAGVLLLLALTGALTVRLLGWHEIKLAQQRLSNHLKQRKRGGECRKIGYEAVERMRQAEHFQAVWSAFTTAAAGLEMDRARLTLAPRQSAPAIWEDLYTLDWTRPGNGPAEEEPGAAWSLDCPLVVGGFLFGRLDVRMATNGQPLERHVPETLQLLTSGLAENLARFHEGSRTETTVKHEHGGIGRDTESDPAQLQFWPQQSRQPVLQDASTGPAAPNLGANTN